MCERDVTHDRLEREIKEKGISKRRWSEHETEKVPGSQRGREAYLQENYKKQSTAQMLPCTS